MSLTAFSLKLDNGAVVPAVQVPPGGALDGLAEALALPACCGAVAVVGGASRFDGPEYEEIRAQASRLLAELANMAAAHRLVLVDGGTPHGVMRLLGEACTARRAPLVGVAPAGQVTWADRPPDEGGQTTLDTNHSAFVLVDVDNWGEEGDTLAAAAYALAGDHSVLEILVNGGEIARRDVWAYLQHGGQLVVIEGSGRFADELAAVIRRGQSDDPVMQTILATKRVHLFSLSGPPGTFAPWLRCLVRW